MAARVGGRKRILFVHWSEEDAAERAGRLLALGYEADTLIGEGALLGRRLTADPRPDSILLDLDRLPANGREVGRQLREHTGTRTIPLIFVGGNAEQVKQTKEVFPDAAYTHWERVGAALRRALARPVTEVVPKKGVQGSGTPLPKKLGIKPSAVVVLLGAPEGFEKTLIPLPKDVQLRSQARGRGDVIVLFCRSESELRRRFQSASRMMEDGAGLWVAWPKKDSGLRTDLDQGKVRAIGLASGLVDNKVCAVDETWSGLRFMRRVP
jgi:CheY-like chemotaxis protein